MLPLMCVPALMPAVGSARISFWSSIHRKKARTPDSHTLIVFTFS